MNRYITAANPKWGWALFNLIEGKFVVCIAHCGYLTAIFWMGMVKPVAILIQRVTGAIILWGRIVLDVWGAIFTDKQTRVGNHDFIQPTSK